ncbi:hypothetical protein BHS04_30755 [Myxococcus xanthus]|nr:hypothetical protein BHS04_30755 [Myxococcus xanthus]
MREAGAQLGLALTSAIYLRPGEFEWVDLGTVSQQLPLHRRPKKSTTSRALLTRLDALPGGLGAPMTQ